MKNLITLILSLFFLNNIYGQGCWKLNSNGWIHTLAIKNDSSLWAWGQNGTGQLGIGSITNKSAPIQIGAALDWKSISGGSYHTIAIKNDGTLWGWGLNTSGQLGDGTFISKSAPIQIGNASDWKSVSTAAYTLAIKNDGTLWGWGQNNVGQLGDGTTTNKSAPIQIGNASDWKLVRAYSSHTIAIKNNGSLWAWGYNFSGQLGDGTTTNKSAPIQIGTTSDWKSISSGYFHSIAIKIDGTLWAWGNNGSGELGDGTTTNKSTPIQIGTATNWKDIAAGSSHSLAIKNDGSLWAWGNNFSGQLGDGTTTSKLTPIQIGTASDWKSISGGTNHTVAIKNDGSLWAWGKNDVGQLGDGTTTDRNTPTLIQCPTTTFNFNSTSKSSFISLSKTLLKVNDILTITGRNFKSNYSHELRIFSYDSSKTILTIPYTADTIGSFSKTVTINNAMTGRFLVSTVDSITNEPVSSRMYEVDNTINEDTSGRYIKIIAPDSIEYYDIGDNNKCQIIWQDKIYNPVVGNTAMSTKSYYIDYNINNGAWQRAATVTYPSEGIYSTIEDFQYTYTFTKVGVYRFRVTEVSNPDNWDMTLKHFSNNSLQPRGGKVQVSAGGIDKNMELSWEWDYSGPKPAKEPNPVAICADGTARVFLKIHRVNTNSEKIKTIEVSANDPQSLATTPELLGRVLYTPQKSKYDLSGNDAINSSSSTQLPESEIRGDYYFWYRAPDNFARGTGDYYSGLRLINLDVKITYQNNKVENYSRPIKIYRPPLVLVHGWNSDGSTWDKFVYNKNGKNINFIANGELFRAGVRPFNMLSSSKFADNGAILSNQSLASLNSLSSSIRLARNAGIACNRVDYIGHSMGGCMLRASIEKFPENYKPNENSTFQFKNYDKGFVNKFITLNTPHNGSTGADLIVDMLPKLPDATRDILGALPERHTKDIFTSSLKFKLLGTKVIPYYKIEKIKDAVIDMQFNNTSNSNGGIRLGAINNIKAFLISGQFAENNVGAILNSDITSNSTWYQLVKLLTYKESCQSKKILVDYVNCKMTDYGVTNFMWNSDFVVPMVSQLAGGDYTNLKPHEALFKNDGAIHWEIHHNVKVGNLCLSKLNEDINGNGFANSIPANPKSGGRTLKSYTLKSADSTVEKYEDMTKFEILYTIPDAIDIDSTLNISIKVKDTTNLKSNMIVFQGEMYENPVVKGNTQYLLKVSPNSIDSQNLFITLTYDSLGYNVNYNYIQRIKVNVQDPVKHIKVEPELKYLYANEEYNPMIYANFEKFISNIHLNNSDVLIKIADTNVVTFNKNSFVAKDSGTTYAFIDYKGKIDTIYMVVALPYTPVEIKCEEPTTEFDYSVTNKTITLTNKSEFGKSYKWTFGNGNTSTNQNEIITYTTNGDYQVCLTTYNDCDSAWICKTVKITDNGSAITNTIANNITIYPNPAKSILNIDLAKNELTTLHIENLLGQVLMKKEISNLKNQLDISSIPKGIYLIELMKTKGEIFSQKLTIE